MSLFSGVLVRRVILLATCAVGACVRTSTEACGDQICPDGRQCTQYQELVLCVSPEQAAACDGLAEGDECTIGEAKGFCYGGVCLEVGCGNGRIDDPIFATHEECDDGNRISHDGCSSTCRDEQPRFDEVWPFGLTPVRSHTLVSDAPSGRMFAFGGVETDGGAGTHLWELVERRWQLATPRIGPSARFDHGAAFDTRRGRMVVFGGENEDGKRFSDTWEFDGTSWLLREPPVAPDGRASVAMAYDPVRAVTVMFTGPTGELGTTWEWNGEDWSQRSYTTPAPTARKHQRMVFDPVRGVMVMIIESSTDVVTYELGDDGWRMVESGELGPPEDTSMALAWDAVARRVVATVDGASETMWAWDGQAWSSMVVTDDPVVHEKSAMAMASNGRPLRVGGAIAVGTPTAQTVAWDGARWSDLAQPAPSDATPAYRLDYAVAFDADRQRVVLFGGETPNNVLLGDTWELGPGGWTRMAPSGSPPPPRRGHVMAYDPVRRQVVMFGDAGGDARTWLWDGTTWTSVLPVPGLAARTNPAMAFDARRRVVVLFGGSDPSGTPLRSDTWTWNGTTWTEVTPTDKPTTRTKSAMAWDPIRENIVLFGGEREASSTRLNDTWLWDGATWTKSGAAAVPTARSDHALAWDATRKRLVLVGGQRTANILTDPAVRDIWEWDGTNWSPLPLDLGTPPERVGLTSGFGYGLIALAGQSATGALGTYRVRWEADTTYETCAPNDRDRDGLVGCADPDCWSVCSPSCPPGAQCAADRPRCGDATCSALESCRTCTSDCGACPVLCGDGACSAGEDCLGDCAP